MNLIELHILQSFPVTCLNRDDVGAPKSALFGGVERARVSSQCWKRAARELAQENQPDVFAGKRTKFVIGQLAKIFATKENKGEERAQKLAVITANAIGKIDSAEAGTVKTLLFFSPGELAEVADKVLAMGIPDDELEEAVKAVSDADSGSKKKGKNALDLSKAVKGLGAKTKDAADIALFGRMVADDHTLTVEGSALFSHALSTHAVASELDFFSAVDDLKKDADDAGAGHIGTIEFNSACYYRYVGVNVDLLKKNLGDVFGPDEVKTVLSAFIKAAILSVPSARKNSMFGHTPPAYVLGLRRSGQPLSLANAFESPVGCRNGYVEPSIEALKKYWAATKQTFGITADAAPELPGVSLDTLVGELVR